MSTLGAVIAIMISGFITGALARFAVPGPDPMPAWMTVSIGLVGSVVGGAIGAVATDRNPYAISVSSFFAAFLLVVAYRKIVQKRPVFGPEALRYPRRGVGVQEYRERLTRAGINPDALLDRALEARREEQEPGDEHGDSESADEASEEPSADDEQRWRSGS